jgi:hypothetical protein
VIDFQWVEALFLPLRWRFFPLELPVTHFIDQLFSTVSDFLRFAENSPKPRCFANELALL